MKTKQETKKKKLKPCPFCGNKEPMLLGSNNDPPSFWVACLKCSADMKLKKKEKSAIKAWNRRES
jgi:Lar family restriction alleviation protein